MDIDEINKNSWLLALDSIMIIKGRKNSDIDCASSGKIREMFEKTSLNNYRNEIKRTYEYYKPSGTHIDRDRDRKRVFDQFGSNLFNIIKDKELNQKETKLLLQYTLWNIKYIEERIKRAIKDENMKLENITKYPFIRLFDNMSRAEGQKELLSEFSDKWNDKINFLTKGNDNYHEKARKGYRKNTKRGRW